METKPMEIETVDLPEPGSKKMKPEPAEPAEPEESGVKIDLNRMEVKLDDLPILPFEKILSHLSLEDRIRSRAVSRRWYKTIDSFRVKTLCCSKHPIGFILGKDRLVSGAFAQNFISSPRFESFFKTFGQSILSNLKHLRLADFELNERNKPEFVPALESFGQLERLDIIGLSFSRGFFELKVKLEPNLPMLNSIQLRQVGGIEKLTLNAPKLRQVELSHSYSYSNRESLLKLELVHGESVEKLITDNNLRHLEVEKLKNLKILYIGADDSSQINKSTRTLLSGLEQLKELHLNRRNYVTELFKQKQRYGRSDLKIYLCGLLLTGEQDPACSLSGLSFFKLKTFAYLAENQLRLADEILFSNFLHYRAIESVAPELAINVLNRFNDLGRIIVDRPVQDIDRFLDILKNCSNIVALDFSFDQPQNLFDRLPEHRALQDLTIDRAASDLGFLFKLENLTSLHLRWPIDAKTVRKLFNELKVLSQLEFKYLGSYAKIRVCHPRRFKVSIDWRWCDVTLPYLDAAINLIIEKARQEIIQNNETDEEDEGDEGVFFFE